MSSHSRTFRAYLAGPTVFFPDALQLGRELVAMCVEHGLEGVYPLIGLDLSSPTATQIFDHNVEALKSSDVVIADVSPFRGPHSDDGTAFEMGMAFALSLPIFTYCSDTRTLTERMTIERTPDGSLRDQSGLQIEDFGLGQNLMVACAPISTHQDPRGAIFAAARYLKARRE